jgi:hypothetical protein
LFSGLAKPLAFWANDKAIAMDEFSVINSPCHTLQPGNPCFISQDLLQLFPKDTFINRHQITAYMAAPLVSISGEVMGYLVVMDASH